MTADFIQALKDTPADKIESKKGEALQFQKALNYLTKFKLLPDDFTAKQQIAEIVKKQEWDKKK
jgi:hypothetical protein